MDILTLVLAKVLGGGGGGSSGGGVLVVNVDEDTGALDKTWQEIHDASFAVIKTTDSNGSYTSFIVAAGKIKNLQTGDYVYVIQFTDVEQSFRAETDSPNGYPVFVDE